MESPDVAWNRQVSIFFFFHQFTWLFCYVWSVNFLLGEIMSRAGLVLILSWIFVKPIQLYFSSLCHFIHCIFLG